MTSRQGNSAKQYNHHLVQAIIDKFPRETVRSVYARAGTVMEREPWKVKIVRFSETRHERKHPHTRDALEEKGGTLRGQRIVNGNTTFLPIFDDSMIAQYNHRWRIVSALRRAGLERDISPELSEMPRRWVEDRHVIQAVVDLPEDLARCFYHGSERDRDRAVAYWVAGYYLNRGDAKIGQKILDGLINPMMSMYDAMGNYLGTKFGESAAPLHAEEVAHIQMFSDAKGWIEYVTERRTPTWLIAVREIGHDQECRRLAAAVLPLVGLDSSLTAVLLPRVGADEAACYLANLNCHVLRFVLEAGEASTNSGVDIKKKLPSVPPTEYGEAVRRFILARVLELVYTAWDLAPFAEACGFSGPPFAWNEQRRFLIRGELEAQYFHLYGIARDDVDHIMETFSIDKKKDGAAYGCFRTKDTILEIYDEMAGAMKTGKPYRTRLDPPPGPPADAEGNFLPLPQWLPGQPQPANWPAHIHGPKEVYDWAKANNIDWRTLLEPLNPSITDAEAGQ